jgi:hypothetical protein
VFLEKITEKRTHLSRRPSPGTGLRALVALSIDRERRSLPSLPGRSARCTQTRDSRRALKSHPRPPHCAQQRKPKPNDRAHDTHAPLATLSLVRPHAQPNRPPRVLCVARCTSHRTAHVVAPIALSPRPGGAARRSPAFNSVAAWQQPLRVVTRLRITWRRITSCHTVPRPCPRARGRSTGRRASTCRQVDRTRGKRSFGARDA